MVPVTGPPASTVIGGGDGIPPLPASSAVPPPPQLDVAGGQFVGGALHLSAAVLHHQPP